MFFMPISVAKTIFKSGQMAKTFGHKVGFSKIFMIFLNFLGSVAKTFGHLPTFVKTFGHNFSSFFVKKWQKRGVFGLFWVFFGLFWVFFRVFKILWPKTHFFSLFNIKKNKYINRKLRNFWPQKWAESFFDRKTYIKLKSPRDKNMPFYEEKMSKIYKCKIYVCSFPFDFFKKED